MAWHGIEGHDEIVERFRHCLARGRLASSFLFVGPEGIGKRTFALKLAQALLCENSAAAALDPCEHCAACQQVAAGTHPDLEVVARPDGKSTLPISLFVGEDDKRGREGLCHFIAMKPFRGGRKAAIIDDADFFSAESANALLKTLEEPPPRSVMILIGSSLEKQLPTIRSRCQIVRFQPLAAETVAQLLLAQGVVESPAEAARLAAFSEGSLARAAELADPALWTFRDRLLSELARRPLDSVGFAKTVTGFVEEAGKDAGPKRDRARTLLRFAADQFRAQLAAEDGVAVEVAVSSADRCLEALGQIDRNANLPNVLECWLDDLGQIAAGKPRAGLGA